MRETDSKARSITPTAGDPWRADGVVALAGLLQGKELDGLVQLATREDRSDRTGVVAMTPCIDPLLANPQLSGEVLARVRDLAGGRPGEHVCVPVQGSGEHVPDQAPSANASTPS